ncbi:hypothetical protein [Nocardioides acrostichi]|uniref:Uncharacterized protein n=1 Tax=Nocardioides acrostichi TaxID=2784339 RepID=A0A930Y4Z8_9ACTN|nr:hypothetical protein [Nocardioides acrostichi]MBF4160730.1 hypothetical protein [Nocardioides acrostichi]
MNGGRTSTPGGLNGFGAAVATNALVALALWFTVTARYGFSGYGAISYHYGRWMWPVIAVLAVTVLAGLVALAVSGRRRLGVGVVLGALVTGLVDLAWSFVYFVSQTS